jgi:D-alanine-D-alanine ligase
VPDENYYHLSTKPPAIPKVFPVIIKPNKADGSFGITPDAVVYNQQEMIEYLKGLHDKFESISLLIQQYLEGTEYSVGLIGNPGNFTMSIIYEIDYSQLPEHLPKILCYDYKWDPNSPYRNLIKLKTASVSIETQMRLLDYAKLLFERLECRDFARFDFRSDKEGNIKLLEVNPNPSGLGDMSELAGIAYEEILNKILQAAKARLHL